MCTRTGARRQLTARRLSWRSPRASRWPTSSQSWPCAALPVQACWVAVASDLPLSDNVPRPSLRCAACLMLANSRGWLALLRGSVTYL